MVLKNQKILKDGVTCRKNYKCYHMGMIKELIKETDPLLDYANNLVDQKLILIEGFRLLNVHLAAKEDKECQKIISRTLIKLYQC